MQKPARSKGAFAFEVRELANCGSLKRVLVLTTCGLLHFRKSENFFATNAAPNS